MPLIDKQNTVVFGGPGGGSAQEFKTVGGQEITGTGDIPLPVKATNSEVQQGVNDTNFVTPAQVHANYTANLKGVTGFWSGTDVEHDSLIEQPGVVYIII